MSSDDPLDPCRQWLGVDAADLGDHRRVLGVSPEERDPLAVLRAADAKLAALRRVSAGSLEFVRAGFVKRVEAARESVLAEIAAAGPTAGTAFRRPPAPSTLAAARPSAPPPPVPVTVPPPVPRPAMPSSMVVATNAGGGPPPITIRTTVYRKKTPVLAITSVMLGLSMVAGGLAYYALVVKPQHDGHGDRRVAGRDSDTQEDAPDADAGPAVAGAQTTDAVPTVEDGDRPPPRARKRRPRSTDAESSPTQRDPQTAVSQETPAPSRRPPAEAMSKPRPVADVADMAEREEALQLDTSLAEVLAALRGDQGDVAEDRLTTAAGRARSADGRRRVEGWKRLAESHRAFAEGRAAALDAVEPGTSFDVGGKKVVIEKLDAEQCVYRASGPPRTVPREKLPAGIVMAVVAGWFGDDPAGHLAIAAYQMARDVPELRLAREWLEKGRAAGADVEPLLAILDDPLLATAADDK